MCTNSPNFISLFHFPQLLGEEPSSGVYQSACSRSEKPGYQALHFLRWPSACYYWLSVFCLLSLLQEASAQRLIKDKRQFLLSPIWYDSMLNNR